MFDHLEGARVGTKQVLTKRRTALHKIFLILTVAHFAQTLYQQPIAVVLNQIVPVGAPDYFDDIPSRAAENRLQFLDDLSVAAHRSVESLQVAVHNENQIVEPLPRSQRDRTQRLRFVHLAIAQERPDFSASCLLQAAV